MNLTVKLHTTLKKFAPPDAENGTIEMQLDPGATPRAIAAILSIPEDFVGAVFIDGQRADLDTALAEGMELNFLAPIGGG